MLTGEIVKLSISARSAGDIVRDYQPGADEFVYLGVVETVPEGIGEITAELQHEGKSKPRNSNRIPLTTKMAFVRTRDGNRARLLFPVHAIISADICSI